MEVLEPYGPRMCKIRCNVREGCSDLDFDEVKLSCQLVVTTNSKHFTSKPTSELCDVINNAQDERVDHRRRQVCTTRDLDRLFEFCMNGKLAKMKRILSKRRAIVNCPNALGATAIMIAVKLEKRRIFDYLVMQKCDFKVVDETNRNVLHYAAASGKNHYGKKLLAFPIVCLPDIDQRDMYGRTPLLSSVRNGNIVIVKMLLQKGADVKTIDACNNTILHVGCIVGYGSIVNYVLSLNIFDIDFKGEDGKTPLMLAVKHGHIKLSTFLRQRGADVKAIDHNNNNMLHMACKGGHYTMVEYVLSLKIFDIDCRGENGRTPLLIAVKLGNARVANLLKRRGADPTLFDDDNKTIY